MSVIPIDTESSRLLEESDSNRRCLAYFGDLWRRIRMEFVVEVLSEKFSLSFFT